MKSIVKIKLMAFLLALFCSTNIQGQDIRFKIKEVYEGEENAGPEQLGTALANKIKQDIPCAKVMFASGFKAVLDEARLMQLTGNPVGDTNLKSLGEAQNKVKYLIINTSKKTKGSNSFFLESKCIELSTGIILAQDQINTSFSTIESDCQKLAESIVDELSELELCPYKGSVNIEVKSDRDETTTSTNPCVDGTIYTEVVVRSNSFLNWRLQKKGQRLTTGSVTYDLNEYYRSEIKTPCYICENGMKGSATITETSESEAKVEGISNESTFEGKQVSDARIKIVFLDNGTYTLLVKATSEKGTLKETTETKVDGPCNAANESKPKDTTTKRMDVPITLVLGPYQGTAEDKVLQQKETKDISQGQEKATITIDFSLTRD